MRNKVKSAAFFVSLIMLCGCNSDSIGIEEDYKLMPDKFTYNVDYDSVMAMTAGKGADLIACISNGDIKTVDVYDSEGKVTSQFSVSYDIIYDLELSDNELFIAYGDLFSNNVSFVDKLDINSGETEFVCKFEGLKDIRSIAVLNDEVLVLGKDISKKEAECDYLLNGISKIDNTDRTVYSFRNGEQTEIPADFPLEMTGGKDSVIIYGCDNSNGFYFTEYSKGKLSERKYTDSIGVLRALSSIGNNTYIACSSTRFDSGAMIAGRIGEDGLSEILNDVFVFGLSKKEIVSNDSFFWCLDNNSKTLIRCKMSAYYKGSETITMLCSEQSYVQPFSCGYNIELLRQENDETALKILSRDKDFDLCYVSSQDNISGNIRDKGSFYPLNDVEGISDYMNSLFPYIQEACTDVDGNIWCLPVAVNVYALYYNDKNCSQYGYDMKELTLKQLVEFINKLKSEGKEDNCGYSSFDVARYFFTKYITENKSFNSSLMRDTAKFIADEFPYNSITGINFSPIDSDIFFETAYSGDIFRLIFDMWDLNTNGLSYYRSGCDLNAAPCPYPNGGKSCVSIIFLCVNPESSHLETVFDYISAIAQYTSERNDVFLFADRNKYLPTTFASDIYGIIENGEIGFAYPDEVYINDYEKYLNGQISLDDFMTEADRKFAAYMNE